jgi:hypothetical protein
VGKRCIAYKEAEANAERQAHSKRHDSLFRRSDRRGTQRVLQRQLHATAHGLHVPCTQQEYLIFKNLLLQKCRRKEYFFQEREVAESSSSKRVGGRAGAMPNMDFAEASPAPSVSILFSFLATWQGNG